MRCQCLCASTLLPSGSILRPWERRDPQALCRLSRTEKNSGWKHQDSGGLVFLPDSLPPTPSPRRKERLSPLPSNTEESPHPPQDPPPSLYVNPNPWREDADPRIAPILLECTLGRVLAELIYPFFGACSSSFIFFPCCFYF